MRMEGAEPRRAVTAQTDTAWFDDGESECHAPYGNAVQYSAGKIVLG